MSFINLIIQYLRMKKVKPFSSLGAFRVALFAVLTIYEEKLINRRDSAAVSKFDRRVDNLLERLLVSELIVKSLDPELIRHLRIIANAIPPSVPAISTINLVQSLVDGNKSVSNEKLSLQSTSNNSRV